MKNFVLIGAGGYIAPQHLKAISETGNRLVAALDKHDSVGVLDTYFPDAHFFTEFERFERYCEKLRRSNNPIHYVCVCSPNYLHDAHIRFGLRIGADVICEKPVVINPWNLEALMAAEIETARKVFVILQLRYHPSITLLRQKIKNNPSDKKYKVDLQYITPRGNWYHTSWKGDINKSGGITTNIGIHFFDVLLWIFGDVREYSVNEHDNYTASGKLELDMAEVTWMLSIDAKKLPEKARANGFKAHRLLTINGEEIEFNDNFTNLHTKSVKEIMAGNGIGLPEVVKVTQLLYNIRNANN